MIRAEPQAKPPPLMLWSQASTPKWLPAWLSDDRSGAGVWLGPRAHWRVPLLSLFPAPNVLDVPFCSMAVYRLNLDYRNMLCLNLEANHETAALHGLDCFN